MLNIDDWRVMYEGQAQDLLKLRASLAKANALSIRADVDRYDYLGEIDRLREALEVARRELGEARAWKVEYCRQVAEKDEQVAEVHLLLFKAEADRDTALAQAAGLREALKKVRANIITASVDMGGHHYYRFGQSGQRETIAAVMKALATPGPTIGEIKAEALEEVAKIAGNAYAARVIRAEAARLRGGPR